MPARRVDAIYRVYLNGISQPTSKLPDEPHIMFPKNPATMDFTLCGEQFVGVTQGKSTLEFEVEINYRDLDNQPYRYSNRTRYEHNNRDFLKITESLDEP
jgi:hypothetical protein